MDESSNLETLFLNEIQNVSGREERELLDEVEDIKKHALVEIEEEAKHNAQMMLDQEIAEIKSDTAISMSRITSGNNKALIAKREFYANEVFDEAKKRLINFSESKEYKTYLMKKIEMMINSFDCSDSIIYVCEKDVSLKDVFQPLLNVNCTISVDPKILIGGYRLENMEKGRVVDETMDVALNAQRSWFYDNATLSVNLDD